MDPLEILRKHYDLDSPLGRLLLVHSRCVADKALECIRRSGLECDERFVEEAALLHDIGILHTDAPSIHCHGDRPYICHGILGREMLEREGLPRHALVCERHTGAGLTADDIRAQRLPLPQRDMLPLSLEEKAICYADKFFSKSGNPTQEKSREEALCSMSRHGEATLVRFLDLERLFTPSPH